MEDGLPDSSVKAIIQTRDGYLWLGTDNGLARFDGVQFKTFDSRNTPELKVNRVASLLEDHTGALWIGTDQGGITRYFHGRFQRMNLGENSSIGIPALLEDSHGCVWAALAGKGFAQFKAGNLGVVSGTNGPVIGGVNQRRELLATDPDVPIATTIYGMKAIARDGDGQIWGATEERIFLLRDDRWEAVSSSPGITALDTRVGGGLWIAGGGRLRERLPDGSMNDLGSYPWAQNASAPPITVMCQDRTGALWVGTLANGVFRRSGNGTWNPVANDGPLFQNVITAILEDREGSIWVGTENGGLHRLKRREVAVVPLPVTARDATAQSVCAARDGSMWIGTGGAGVFRYQNENGRVRFTQFGETKGLTDPYAAAVLEDSHTNLWVATRGGLFTLEKNRFRNVSEFGTMPGWVMSLFEDRRGRLWVGAYGGVACKDGDNVKWFSTRDGLAHPDVRAITEDVQGNIWVGTAGGGLHRIQDGRIRHYDEAEGLSSSMVVALLPDRDGTLWIGTHEGGLIRMRDGQFTTFTTADGLRSNIAGHLAEDTEGNLWITSVRGLMRVSKAALNNYAPTHSHLLPCLTLTVNDGLFSQICSGGTQPAVTWSLDGKLWIPNMKAIAIVDPQNVTRETPANVVMEEVWVNGRVQPLDSGNALRVEFGMNRFDLRYTALNLAAAEEIRFRYKLDGWDNDWVDAGVRRSASYGALPASEYKFRVLASGRDGIWNETAEPILLTITPRFWQTWWFRIGSGFSTVSTVAIGVFLVSRRKAQRERERLERAAGLERERARIAQDIHDELGAGLAQIGLLADIGQNDTSETARSLTGIAQRARTTVTALDEIVWAVNPSNDNLTRLADYLCRLAEECFETGPTRCYKEVPTNLPPVPVRAEVRHNLTMAVKEALTNTLKHARASEVWLRLTWSDPNLMVMVEDNGQGFDPSAAADGGNGLANQQARLKRLGGAVELRSTLGKGTRTIFRVQLTLENK